MLSIQASHEILPVWGVVKQRSSSAPRSTSSSGPRPGEVLGRELRMRDHDLAHALLERGVDDREDLVAARGGRSRTASRGGQSSPAPRASAAAPRRASSTTGTVAISIPCSRRSSCKPHPYRDLRAGWGLALVGLVDRVDGRHPNGPGSLARGDLDRERVHPADRAVDRDSSERLDPRHCCAHDARPLSCRRVVRLEDEPGHPQLLEAPRQRHVVDLTLNDVGADVDMGVERALEQLARSPGRQTRSSRRRSATRRRHVTGACASPASAASGSPTATASTIAACSANERSLRPGSRIVRYWNRTSWELSIEIRRVAVSCPAISSSWR